MFFLVQVHLTCCGYPRVSSEPSGQHGDGNVTACSIIEVISDRPSRHGCGIYSLGNTLSEWEMNNDYFRTVHGLANLYLNAYLMQCIPHYFVLFFTLILSVFIGLCGQLIHMLQGCFISLWVIAWLQHFQWSKDVRYEEIDHYWSKPKQQNTHTLNKGQNITKYKWQCHWTLLKIMFNTGNGLVPSGNKPLPEPVLT